MNKHATSIKYGLLAGIIMSILLLLVYFVSKATLVSGLMTLLYLPVLFLMIWGGINVRREHGGFGSFGEAFLAVFIISVSATIVYDSSRVILFKVIDPGLSAYVKDKSIETATERSEKYGASEEQIEKQTKWIEEHDFTSTTWFLIGYLISFVIGAFLSLLIALFVRRGGEEPRLKAEG